MAHGGSRIGSTSLLLSAWPGVSAAAQTAGTLDDPDEILVNAILRSEAVGKVAVSITFFSYGALTTQGIRSRLRRYAEAGDPIFRETAINRGTIGLTASKRS